MPTFFSRALALTAVALVFGCVVPEHGDGAAESSETSGTPSTTTDTASTSPTDPTTLTVTGASDADPTTGEDPATSTDAGEVEGDTSGSTSGGPVDPLVFAEVDGIVAVEAEHAFAIEDNGTERAWYVFSAGDVPEVLPDPDPPHHEIASGGSCLEGLPDTRVTHDDELQSGVNFFGSGGEGPILRYRVVFTNVGTYYVRARAYSTGGEDNGLHVGVDGTWPASGERIQFCDGKNQWTWSGAQRTEANHCGEENGIFIDILAPGEHEIAFSMREDGFEFDKWMLTLDPAVFPEGEGPAEVVHGE